MFEQELKQEVRHPFLGEVETEIVGMQYFKAKIDPGEQINLERESKNAHDRRAIRVENGQAEPVGSIASESATTRNRLIGPFVFRADGSEWIILNQEGESIVRATDAKVGSVVHGLFQLAYRIGARSFINLEKAE